MKKLYKITAMMLVLVMIGCGGIVSSGAKNQVNIEQYSIYEIRAGLVPGVSPESVAGMPYSATDDTVCLMRIYADRSSDDSSSSENHSYGHAFLTFMNTSSQNITVGRFTVAPGKMISIGKFGNMGEAAQNFKGAFYNVEAQRKEILGWYTGAVSHFYELSYDELEIVSDEIIDNEDGYNAVRNNCATFAGSVWNSVFALTDVKHLESYDRPTQIYSQITAMNNYLVGNSVMVAHYNRCYYDGVLKSCGDPYMD